MLLALKSSLIKNKRSTELIDFRSMMNEIVLLEIWMKFSFNILVPCSNRVKIWSFHE